MSSESVVINGECFILSSRACVDSCYSSFWISSCELRHPQLACTGISLNFPLSTLNTCRYLTMSSCCERTSNAERLWQAANIDIKAIEIIISSHFGTSLSHYTRMDDGAFARVFLFTLENGMQVIARIILPVRESVKTEAEVAAMELVRGHYR